VGPGAGSPTDVDDHRWSPLVSPPGDFAATRRIKVVCTIGPATAERIVALAGAGIDVARINFSHGTPESHQLDGDASLRPESARYPARRRRLRRRRPGRMSSAPEQLRGGSHDRGGVDPGVGQLLLRGRRTGHVRDGEAAHPGRHAIVGERGENCLS
jgi:hypothetical protein